MWMKILGALLVVTASSGMGLRAVWNLRERIRLLETLRRMASHMRGEILYANAPLSIALSRTGRREEGKAARLFAETAGELEEGEGTLEEIWEAKVETLFSDGPISRTEREQLLRFGRGLGLPDRDMQEKNIQLYLEELELSLGQLRREEPDKSRMFFGMGVLSGLFLTVLLI